MSGGMSVQRSPEYRQAALAALRWCAWYTRGLDERVAAARQDEIASDLHEQASWAVDHGWTSRELARSIRSRQLRGAPADLRWRLTQARVANRRSRLELRLGAFVLAAVLTSGAALVGLASFAVFRMLQAGGQVAALAQTWSVTVLAAMAITAVCLVFARRTRVAGALLLLVPALSIPVLSGSMLWYVSATMQALAQMTPWWTITATAAGVALSVLYLSAAAYWWLNRSPAPKPVEVRHV